MGPLRLSCRQLLPRVAMSLLAGLLIGHAAPAAAGPYTLADLGTGGEGRRLWATGLNDSGQVVGYSYSNGFRGESTVNDYQAVVTGPNGVGLTLLGASGNGWSQARSINNAGEVAGTLLAPDGNPHAFFSAPGEAPRDLGTLPGQTHSEGKAIGPNGEVGGVGFLTSPHGGSLLPLPLASVGGQNFPLDVRGIAAHGELAGNVLPYPNRTSFRSGPGGADIVVHPGAEIFGMSSGGQVAGGYDTSELGYAAFGGAGVSFAQEPRYVPGRLGAFGQGSVASSSHGNDVNDRGQVVGQLYAAYGGPYAFVTTPEGMAHSLDSLFDFSAGSFSPFFIDAPGINEAGQVLANAINGHAYLLTPVPEPLTGLMLLSGIGVIAVAGRRSGSPSRKARGSASQGTGLPAA